MFCLCLCTEQLKKAKFEVLPSWGIDMGSEHERYLTEKHYKQPVSALMAVLCAVCALCRGCFVGCVNGVRAA